MPDQAVLPDVQILASSTRGLAHSSIDLPECRHLCCHCQHSPYKTKQHSQTFPPAFDTNIDTVIVQVQVYVFACSGLTALPGCRQASELLVPAMSTQPSTVWCFQLPMQ